jgi:hypothetical protein
MGRDMEGRELAKIIGTNSGFDLEELKENHNKLLMKFIEVLRI